MLAGVRGAKPSPAADERGLPRLLVDGPPRGWADDHVFMRRSALTVPSGERDQVAGWFHVGVCAAPGAYKARRTNIANKTKWLTN